MVCFRVSVVCLMGWFVCKGVGVMCLIELEGCV